MMTYNPIMAQQLTEAVQEAATLHSMYIRYAEAARQAESDRERFEANCFKYQARKAHEAWMLAQDIAETFRRMLER